MSFFHLKQINNKWFLISPDGEPFFMRGANHYADGTYLPLNRDEKYGDTKAFREAVKDRHVEWGFNYLPPSIGPSEIDEKTIIPTVGPDGKTRPRGKGHRTAEWSAADYAEADFPFTPFLGFPRQYMGGGSEWPDVFSKEFRAGVDQRCREMCQPLKDNPNLIGYHFCQNPPWHPHADSFFDWCHAIVVNDPDARRQWAQLMHRIYGTIDRWRETYSAPLNSFEDLYDFEWPMNGKISAVNLRRDKIAFMKRVCDEWYKVYTESIRKYDPNHLILGDRNSVHLQPLPDWAIHIMTKYIDVVSINVMGPMHVALKEMEQITEHWDGPIHCADTGAGIYKTHPQSAYMCKDYDEFEDVYSTYVRLGIEHPQVIGLGWCGYFETQSMRSGLVDSVTDEPDPGKITPIKKWNAWFDERYPALVGK